MAEDDSKCASMGYAKGTENYKSVYNWKLTVRKNVQLFGAASASVESEHYTDGETCRAKNSDNNQTINGAAKSRVPIIQ
jgi:hypothetical protein